MKIKILTTLLIGTLNQMVVLFLLLSCSENKHDDVLLKLQIQYPFYPWEQYVISNIGDTVYVEYSKLYNEIDTLFKLPRDKKISYRKIMRRNDDHTFSYNLMKTDSLHYFEGMEFIKDTLKNLLVIKETDNTVWTLIDSMTVSEVMYSYKKKVSSHDLGKVIELIEHLKTDQAKDTSSCLDGTNTFLEYKRNGVLYSYAKNCDYSDNESLNALVNLCQELKKIGFIKD